ncbi:MAG: glycosyltransferase family 2 protein [Gallionella sp.]|nr:glycosyltransferase family 2 protein [Gallionella sp.]
MGAVNFSIDLGLVSALKEVLPLDVFVETGTFRGDTVNLVKDIFRDVYTVELSAEYYAEARSRFGEQAHIHLVHSDSVTALADWAPNLRGRSVLYFLDAHWCVAANTAGEASQCPLLGEIRAIDQLSADSLIVIDDARLFLAPPPAPHEISQWPTFSGVIEALHGVSISHQVMVLNDAIIFFPRSIAKAVQDYGQAQGVDWLSMLHKTRDYDNLRVQFDHLQVQFDGLQSQLDDMLVQLKSKDVEIGKLKEATIERDVEIGKLKEATVERDVEIGELKEATIERDVEIGELLDVCQEREKLIHYQARALHTHYVWRLRGYVRRLRGSLAHCQPSIAQHLVGRARQFAAKAWLPVGRVRQFAAKAWFPVRRARQFVAKAWLPRLGVLNQHPPRPLNLPKRHDRISVLSNSTRISIVTPSFNQAVFLERTLQSVLEQNYPALEYIVQDGGSEDGSVEILGRYADQLTFWESKLDKGQTNAINLGFRHASGEIMAYLNSDDLLLPGALAHVASYFEKHPEIDVIYGHRIIVDENDYEIGRWILPAHDDNVLTWVDFVPQETLFWRRRIWDNIGGSLDESFHFAMDWDLLLRFRDAGAKFVRLPNFLAAFRVHPQQKTSAQISDIGFKEMSRLRQRCHGNEVSDGDIRRGIASYMLRHVATDLIYRIKTKLGGKR